MFRINGFPSCFCKKNCYFQWIEFNWLIFPTIHWTCRGCTWPSLRWIKAPKAGQIAMGNYQFLGGSPYVTIKICWSFHPAMLMYGSVYLIHFQMYHCITISSPKKNTTKPHRPVFEVVTPLAGWRIGRGTMGDMHNSIIPQWTNLTRCVIGNRVAIYEYIHICKNRQSRINTSR